MVQVYSTENEVILDIDLDEPNCPYETYQDIVDALKKNAQFIDDINLLQDIDTKQNIEVEDTIQADQDIVIASKPFKIKIYDSGDDEGIILEMKRKGNIAAVIDVYEEKTGKSLEFLSYKGQRLDKDNILEDLGLDEDPEFKGRIKIYIVCDLQEKSDEKDEDEYDDDDDDDELKTAVEIYEFEKIQDVLRKFEEISGRILLDQHKLYFKGQMLNLDDSVYLHRISDNDELRLQSPFFQIIIKDPAENQSTEIQVKEFFTLKQLIKRFNLSMASEEVAQDEDRLIFNNQLLEADEPIYKYKITNDSVLTLRRNDASLEVAYTCAQCGEDVKLKRDDEIVCPQCLHFMVFKKRSEKPCQYTAR